MDLGGFVNSYNSVAAEKLDYKSIYTYIDENETVFETFFGEDEPEIVLKLIVNNDRINSVRIAMAKIDQNGNAKVPSSKTITDFIEAAKNAIQAFCGFDKSTAEALLTEFQLYDIESYNKKGELTKTQDSFYFLYYSDSIVCDMIITNTYLKETEKTEKPESKPAFGNTTKLRTETAASE